MADRDRPGSRMPIEADLSLHALAGLGAGLAAPDLVALLTTLICLRDQDGDARQARRTATCGTP